ncbi:MAG: AbrB/MazE/SpoVT family DNA-binding domain-containing protein [Candidatus Omnitrophica bacterium]|nr:AbrB/MazE/SpoVT family DNA-binding domain-containing protein [Candidatus Omnitrophota bacterium]
MLAKLTRGNQLTIPKRLVEQAHLKVGRDYLDVVYTHGVIVLKPVDVEERIPPEAYEALIRDALTVKPGDILVDERSADSVLKRRIKKR